VNIAQLALPDAPKRHKEIDSVAPHQSCSIVIDRHTVLWGDVVGGVQESEQAERPFRHATMEALRLIV
jgi:hypothetical protein